MKIPLILNALGILLCLSACYVVPIPHPASIRALTPKFLDPQYKEFKKFSQQELGRVLYARPLTEIEKNLTKGYFYRFATRYEIDNNDMFVGIEYVFVRKRMVYIYIKELGYYSGWNKSIFNFPFFGTTHMKIYNSIKSITIDNSQIIQNKEVKGALKGKSWDNLLYIVIENSLDEPSDFIVSGYRSFYYFKGVKSSLDELKYLRHLYEMGYVTYNK